MMDDLDIDPEIAAAMGFSTFGNQHQPKRRKVDHDKPASSGSGSNSVQLGFRNQKPQDDNVTASSLETLAQSSAESASIEDSGAPPAESGSSRAKIKQPAPSGLAAYIARAKALPDKPPASTAAQLTPMTPHTTETTPHTTERPSPVANAVLDKPVSELSNYDLSVLRKGVIDANGDTVYFQPNFIEDPWSAEASHRRRPY